MIIFKSLKQSNINLYLGNQRSLSSELNQIIAIENSRDLDRYLSGNLFKNYVKNYLINDYFFL